MKFVSIVFTSIQSTTKSLNSEHHTTLKRFEDRKMHTYFATLFLIPKCCWFTNWFSFVAIPNSIIEWKLLHSRGAKRCRGCLMMD